jgi:SAM-dependent methyltransferase
MAELDPEIVRYYTEQFDEDARLRSGINELEFVRTQEIVRRYLPEGRLRILDVGGAGGIHAEWLLADGHSVHLVDPVERHVDEASSRLGALVGFSAEVADGRTLPVADGSFDVVLLLGPLYHLPDRRDRDRTWSEASRATVSGGLIIAASISRFASLFAGLTEREIFKDEFRAIVTQDLATGHHDNVTRNEDYFTTAYFHRPDELEDEAATAELTVLEILGVEGLAAVLPQLSEDWEDPTRRKIIVESARLIESEPSLLGLGPHLLLVARRP